MVEIPFLKKLSFPKLDLHLARPKTSFIGIDIGTEAAKVVQLKKEQERAILETYGELKTARYFKKTSGVGSGFLKFLDQEVADMVKDLLIESNVTTNQAILGIPSISSFITVIDLPLMSREEVKDAVPFEARRYIPIPLAEVAMDWEVIEEDAALKRMKILVAVVPNEVVSKYKRIGELTKLDIQGLEIESFSLVRSLIGRDRGVVAIVHLGAQTTTVTVADNRVVRSNTNIGRGSREVTMTLARSLGIDEERAEAMKREVGLSARPEEKEIVDTMLPVFDKLFNEVERIFAVYNRANVRKVERIILVGGGSSLNGLVDYVSKKIGLETALGSPFALTVYPAFMQPILKDIGPGFGVAVGLALRAITSR